MKNRDFEASEIPDSAHLAARKMFADASKNETTRIVPAYCDWKGFHVTCGCGAELVFSHAGEVVWCPKCGLAIQVLIALQAFVMPKPREAV